MKNCQGIPYGPIMASTRKVYERKLQNALEGNPIENGNGSLLNGSASENGGSMNGNRGSVAARTPSRESTPLIEQRAQTVVNGNEGGGAQREVCKRKFKFLDYRPGVMQPRKYGLDKYKVFNANEVLILFNKNF